MGKLELHDIQGLVVSGYAHMHRATYLLLKAGDDRAAARAWLADLADRVTTSLGREETRCINVAFTPSGLRALGVSDADLRSFTPPFREGMGAKHRTNILGDVEGNDPQHWEWGGCNPDDREANDPDVLLMVFARDDATFDHVEAEELELLGQGGLRVVHQLTPERLPGRQSVGKFGIEHFGFADGMSQPVIRGTGQEDKLAGDDARRAVIAAGEFVLGYENGYGKLTTWPRLTARPGGAEFGRNGSYLVFRHLRQDVAGFWQYVDAQTKRPDGGSDPEARDRLAAKMVGRWPSGAPLVKAPHRDDPELGTDNSFGYAAWDPQGTRCPLASHARRTNPRDSLRGTKPARSLQLANLHRIVRRGRVYGPALDDPLGGDDGQDRGLFFLCLNANIERQFEFIQHTWCNNPKFSGLYDELDPVIGNQPDGGGHFTVQDQPVRGRFAGLPTFVTTRGGGYFFMPGVAALRCLAGAG